MSIASSNAKPIYTILPSFALAGDMLLYQSYLLCVTPPHQEKHRGKILAGYCLGPVALTVNMVCTPGFIAFDIIFGAIELLYLAVRHNHYAKVSFKKIALAKFVASPIQQMISLVIKAVVAFFPYIPEFPVPFGLIFFRAADFLTNATLSYLPDAIGPNFIQIQWSREQIYHWEKQETNRKYLDKEASDFFAPLTEYTTEELHRIKKILVSRSNKDTDKTIIEKFFKYIDSSNYEKLKKLRRSGGNNRRMMLYLSPDKKADLYEKIQDKRLQSLWDTLSKMFTSISVSS